MSYLIDFFIAYLLTNIIEFIPFNLLIKKKLSFKLPRLILINSVTLPLLWLFLPFFYQTYFLSLFIGEVLVVLAETILIKFLLKQEWLDAFKVSLLMNFLSASAGLLV